MAKPITVVSKATGEIFEFKADTDSDLAASYDQIRELVAALERAKTKIKTQVLQRMEAANDDSIDLGAYRWRKQIRHYLNYDLATMHRVLDEDMVNELVQPDKTKVDQYIKDSVAGSGAIPPEAVSELRESMVVDKPPSVAVILEKS